MDGRNKILGLVEMFKTTDNEGFKKIHIVELEEKFKFRNNLHVKQFIALLRDKHDRFGMDISMVEKDLYQYQPKLKPVSIDLNLKILPKEERAQLLLDLLHDKEAFGYLKEVIISENNPSLIEKLNDDIQEALMTW